MPKRCLLLMLAAIVLVIPAAAQAEGPLITNSFGEAAETIEATSENTGWTTTLGTMSCTTVMFHLDLSQNSGTAATGNGAGTAQGDGKIPTHSGPCRSSSGLGTDVIDFPVTDVHLSNGSGSATFSMTYLFTSGSMVVAHCTWNGTVTLVQTGTSSLSMSGMLAKTAPSSAACPTEGTIGGDFTLNDEFGLPAHV